MQKNISFILMLILSAVEIYAEQTEQTDSLARELQEVLVTSNQSVTKLVGTTLVSTIVGTDLQNLGTALDVLSQLPMIKVSDNVVSVIGKGSPEIYIDGRPMRSDDELEQLRSDNIKRVEFVMAPGAMYASETKAVLRITTRRNFVDGLSAFDSAESTVRWKWSANNLLDLNHRIGSWDVFASGRIASNNSVIKGITTNDLLYNGEDTEVGSEQHKSYHSVTGFVKTGFNYAKGALSFGAYYRFNPERGDFANKGSEWLGNGPEIIRNIDKSIRGHSHLASMYYDDTFAGKYLLHFDGDYKSSYSGNDVAATYPSDIISDVKSADCWKSRLWAGKLYLSFPFAKGNLTIGTQDSYTTTTLDYNMLNSEVGTYIPSSVNDARQISSAIFAKWDRMFGPFSLSAGLHGEYVDYLFKINGEKDRNVSRKDYFITPDILIGYTFNKESSVSLSYKVASVKPPYSQLTGSLSYVGIHEIEGGNPTLRDEHRHDVQIIGTWSGFMLQADYTRGIDTYGFVKRVYPVQSLQLIMQPVNIDVSALDMYMSWGKRIKLWKPEITLGMYKQWLTLNGVHYNRPIFSYYLDNMIALPKGFFVTLNMRGQTQGDMHTNQFGATWFVLDASVSKAFFNKSLQLKLSATDIFNTCSYDWTMDTYGVFVNKRQSYDHRGVSLSLTYRFQSQTSKYKGKPASESEMNRL